MGSSRCFLGLCAFKLIGAHAPENPVAIVSPEGDVHAAEDSEPLVAGYLVRGTAPDLRAGDVLGVANRELAGLVRDNRHDKVRYWHLRHHRHLSAWAQGAAERHDAVLYRA